VSIVYHDSGAVGSRGHFRGGRDSRGGKQMAHSAALGPRLFAEMSPSLRG
jgi:hypothetical protein